MSFLKKLIVGGIAKRLTDKYMDKTDLTCETVELIESDDKHFKDNFLGKNCKLSVAGFEFEFNEVKTRSNLDRNSL